MIIQDNFCPDTKVLDTLKQHDVWQQMIGKLNWWDGWWNAPPRNNWEFIIQQIWSGRGIESQIAGFEYWCNILDADSDINHLGWHSDKDEALKNKEGKIVHPAMGTVFYGFPHQIEGGFLEIAYENTLSELERIAPVYNRLIIFDASKQHHVTKVYKGKRYGFQVNLWQQKPTTFATGDVSTTQY